MGVAILSQVGLDSNTSRPFSTDVAPPVNGGAAGGSTNAAKEDGDDASCERSASSRRRALEGAFGAGAAELLVEQQRIARRNG